MPKVIRDFITGTTHPNQGPVTFPANRDFYSNATRLSEAEMNRLTPNPKCMGNSASSDLGDSIEQVTQPAGRLQDYFEAMANYRAAGRVCPGRQRD